MTRDRRDKNKEAAVTSGTEGENKEKKQPEEEIVEPENALPEITFDELSEGMKAAAGRAGWSQLMDVQRRAIPYLLAKRDVMIQSRTGSGKTGAFLLPILERIDIHKSHCQAMILVPTRELAQQVAHEAEMLGKDTDIRIAVVYGGTGYGRQIEALRGGAHLVIGTPGRILDHLLKGTFSLKELQVLVLDEADRMLSMGFYPDMLKVKGFLPSRKINAYLFSATFPPYVIRLAGLFLEHPEILSLSRDHVHVAETQHIFYIVPAMEKDRALIRIIEMENPVSCIIFCNTKSTVNFVSIVLQRFGYNADQLTSDLTQNARDRVLGRVRSGNLRFLVATDVAARGIDIPDLSHVILYEPPEDPEAYIHRAGRTGRAGASGEAISLVSSREQMDLVRIGKRFNIELLERPLPSDEDVEKMVSQRVIAMLESRLRGYDNVKLERMKRFIPLAKNLEENEEEMSLIASLLDDYYQQTLHAPPVLPQSGETAAAPDSSQRRKKSYRRGGKRRRR